MINVLSEDFLLESLRHLLVDILDLDSAAEVGPDASTETLHEWDSFAHMALITAVQDSFGVPIGAEDIERTLSLRDLAGLVAEKRSGRTSAGSGIIPPVVVETLNELWRAVPPGKDEVIYIHSRTDAMLRTLRGDLGALLGYLRGNDGERTLVFPAFPFSSRSYSDYLARCPDFSVRTTPAMTGLLPALALRLPDCQRSAHPLLSEAALGPQAMRIIADAHRDPHPFHSGSTYARLLDLDASMMGLGVDIATNALIHYVDDLVRERLPFPLYGAQRVKFAIEHADGSRESRSFLAYDREMTKRIKPRLIRPLFAGRPDILTEMAVAEVPFYRLRLRPFLETLLAAAHTALDAGRLPPWYPDGSVQS